MRQNTSPGGTTSRDGESRNVLSWVIRTLEGASVHPREVVKQPLARNASAVILAHNHPSGFAEPSQADEIITTRLRDALTLVEIRLLDHLIIGDGCCVSLAEKGLI